MPSSNIFHTCFFAITGGINIDLNSSNSYAREFATVLSTHSCTKTILQKESAHIFVLSLAMRITVYWSEIEMQTNTDKAYDAFLSLLRTCYDAAFPL